MKCDRKCECKIPIWTTQHLPFYIPPPSFGPYIPFPRFKSSLISKKPHDGFWDVSRDPPTPPPAAVAGCITSVQTASSSLQLRGNKYAAPLLTFLIYLLYFFFGVVVPICARFIKGSAEEKRKEDGDYGGEWCGGRGRRGDGGSAGVHVSFFRGCQTPFFCPSHPMPSVSLGGPLFPSPTPPPAFLLPSSRLYSSFSLMSIFCTPRCLPLPPPTCKKTQANKTKAAASNPSPLQKGYTSYPSPARSRGDQQM